MIELQEIPINEGQRKIRNIGWEATCRINNLNKHDRELYDEYMRDPKGFMKRLPCMR